MIYKLEDRKKNVGVDNLSVPTISPPIIVKDVIKPVAKTDKSNDTKPAIKDELNIDITRKKEFLQKLVKKKGDQSK